MTVETDWADVEITRAEWLEAFGAPESGTPHNEARDEVWAALVDLVIAKHDDDVPAEQLRKSLADNDELTTVTVYFDNDKPAILPVSGCCNEF